MVRFAQMPDGGDGVTKRSFWLKRASAASPAPGNAVAGQSFASVNVCTAVVPRPSDSRSGKKRRRGDERRRKPPAIFPAHKGPLRRRGPSLTMRWAEEQIQMEFDGGD